MQEMGAANRPCWQDAAQMRRKSRFQLTQSEKLIELTENLLRTAIALVCDLYFEVFCKSLNVKKQARGVHVGVPSSPPTYESIQCRGKL